MLVPIIDDAHLMQPDCLRKLRLLFEDFPRSHNLVLIAQPPLLQTLAFVQNEDEARSTKKAQPRSEAQGSAERVPADGQ